MSKNSIIISSFGLKNITFPEEEDLTLIFGNQEIQMKRIFAEFISPIVSHFIQSDPTIQFINFNDLTDMKSDAFNQLAIDILTPDIISLFKEISSGFSIEINNTQAFKLRFLSIIIGNEELFQRINKIFPQDFSEENLSTYIDSVQSCYLFSQFSADFDFSCLIDYLAQNFYLIDEDKFLKLPRPIQYSIISNPKLQIKSEDSLLDTIMTIIHNDQFSPEKVSSDDEKIEGILFLEHIEFTSLTEEKLREFLSSFDFNLTTNSLWKKFYECFFIHFDKKPERIGNKHSDRQTFEYIDNKTDRFKGIINYLTEKFGGNVVDKGIIKMTSSSVFDNNLPKNAVDFTSVASSFSTTVLVDKSNPWLKFDFLSRKVHPTHYSIRSCNIQKGMGHPKNWIIEGSNSGSGDDDSWTVLDCRKNDTHLNDRLAEFTFDVQKSLDENEYYRYIRIRQTGLNCKNTSQFMFNSIEFFGTII